MSYLVMFAAMAAVIAGCGAREKPQGCMSNSHCDGGDVCAENICTAPSGAEDETKSEDAADQPNNGDGQSDEEEPGNNDDGTPIEPATCEDACANIMRICMLGVAGDECLNECEADATPDELACASAATTCEELDDCGAEIDDDAPGGLEGDECVVDEECFSGFCWIPENAFAGICAVDDFGADCDAETDCENFACVVEDGAELGFCTAQCVADSECPFGWICEALPDEAADYCVPL